MKLLYAPLLGLLATVPHYAQGSGDATGPWITMSSPDPLTQDIAHTVTQAVPEGTLIIRCVEMHKLSSKWLHSAGAVTENPLEVYVNWNQFISLGPHGVTYRIGDGPLRQERWSVSTNHKSTFAAKPKPFLRDLLAAPPGTLLILRTSPYSENAVTATFNLDQLATAAATLGNCKIDK